MYLTGLLFAELQETKQALSTAADVAEDIARDVRAKGEPAADAAAEKIEAAAHEGGQQVKRVADVASKQVLPCCFC